MSELTVADVGEFGLIDILRDALPPKVVAAADLRIGIGDDAAVWTPPAGESIVVTTDSLVEDIHFRLGWTDWKSLGWKSLAVNLSDLAAMGAEPQLAVVSLGLRGSERVSDLQAFYHGLGELAATYGVTLAGGDLVAAPTAVLIHVTAIGSTRHGATLTRGGARNGDIIGVSGTIGAARAGLQLLQLADDDPRRLARTASHLIAAHIQPHPRIELGRVLLEQGATAAMDLSDGLFGDLPKILTMSRVGAEINQSVLPVAASVRALFPERWLEFATRGGEDYELLFTAPEEAFTKIAAQANTFGTTVTAIGKIITSERLLLRGDNGEEAVADIGAFDHFHSR